MKRRVPCAHVGEDNSIVKNHNDTADLSRLIKLMTEQKWEIVIDRITSGDFNAEITLVPSKEHPMTLLHIACTLLTIPVVVILTIIELDHHAALTEDEDGDLPIHLACAGGLSLQVIEALMIGCPKSCLQKDYQGNIPMQYIMNNTSYTDIKPLVSTLISRLPPSCIYNQTTSILHEVMSVCEFDEQVIQQIIQMHPQVCQI